MAVTVYLLLLILASASSIVSASDPGPLQDFCVATDGPKGVFVNGKFCKEPKDVKAEDFYKHTEPANTDNQLGVGLNNVVIVDLDGLNTLGTGLGRIDYAPKGLLPLHTHPRASEIFYVMKGTLYAGFVTSREDGYRFFSKTLNKGDVFIFPVGLIHFQYNIGKDNAVALAFFNSQNPGFVFIGDAVLNSKPRISEDILARNFNVDKKVMEELQKNY